MQRGTAKSARLGINGFLLFTLGASLVGIYKITFGLLDEHLYRRSRRRFIAEIQRDFAYLLTKHAGKVVPHEGKELPRAFDYVAVSIEFQEIRVRLIRGRGELDAQIAPMNDPYRWQNFSRIWDRIAMPEWGELEDPTRNDLIFIASRLQTCWDRLIAVISADY